jgi:membrane-associated phospholipid phosphatase
MQWLQALDTALFHFINGSLGNPFFDWLMPLLSGGNGAMTWFVLAIIAGYIVALILGDARVRLCAVLIFLSVAIGDGLVTNTIKHLVHRPRPCMALSDVVERLGCSASGSMPSAHAANWFVATMIVFIFYRRKLWLMVPVAFMAVAVAFSRVYNGVHYPGDVLAGAIVGAGTASAVAVAVQWLWQILGRRYFPLWHARMPSLLNPQTAASVSGAQSEAAIESDDSHWLRLGGIVIVVSLIGRLIYLASGTIELSGDEAYQWLWSKHLALSYYSKPLGIAWIQFAGTSLFGDNDFGVRFFSPVFGAILSWLSMRFLSRELGANGGGRTAFWLLVIVSAVPLLAVGSILMTIDPPLVLCWTWAVIAGWRAVQPEGQTRDWVIVGVAAGLAFLCKYSALYLIVCFAIFFALWPPSRVQLRKPGPWLALGILLLSLLPVIIWNAQHHWITVEHVKGNAGLNSHWRAPWEFIGDFWGSELGLLNPVFFIAALWASIAFWKYRRAQPLMLYLFCLSWTVFFGHALYAFRARILPNWIAPAMPAMFLLMALYWHERLRAGSRVVKPLLAAGIALGAIMVTVLYESNLIGKIAGEPLPGAIDPLHRVRAWKTGAELVEGEREKLEAQGKPAFIICDDYETTGEFTFYSEPARKAVALHLPIVYCEDSDTPGNQFYFWPEYNYRAARQGENAIYADDVGAGDLEHGWVPKWLHHEPLSLRPLSPPPPPARMVSEFEKVEDLGMRDIMYRDRVFHRVHLWACYNLK